MTTPYVTLTRQEAEDVMGTTCSHGMTLDQLCSECGEAPAMTTATKTHHAYRYTITEDSWGMRVYSVYLRNSDGNGLVRVAFVDTPQEMQAFVERNCGPGDTWSLINEDS